MRNAIIISGIVLIIIIVIFTLQLWLHIFDNEAKRQGDLFKGDHITIDLNITEDGRTVELVEPNIRYSSEANQSEHVTYANGLFKTEGGKYGCYSFTLVIPCEALETYSEDLVLKLDYINTNDWYIVEIECNVDIETVEKTYEGSIAIDCYYNDGTHSQYIEDILIEDNIIYAHFGM